MLFVILNIGNVLCWNSRLFQSFLAKFELLTAKQWPKRNSSWNVWSWTTLFFLTMKKSLSLWLCCPQAANTSSWRKWRKSTSRASSRWCFSRLSSEATFWSISLAWPLIKSWPFSPFNAKWSTTRQFDRNPACRLPSPRWSPTLWCPSATTFLKTVSGNQKIWILYLKSTILILKSKPCTCCQLADN